MHKKLLFILFILLLFGCKKSDEGNVNIETIRTGSQGIVFDFLPNNPPPEFHASTIGENKFTVAMKVNNKGAYPQPNDFRTGPGPKNGKLFLTGYDPNILQFEVVEQQSAKSADLGRMALEGKSTINPNGGQDIISFVGNVDVPKLNVKVYEPIFMATACYYYETIAGPQVCVDPIPYSTLPQRKVCEVSDKTLGDQGGPVAITYVKAEPFATKTQFKITIKNVGGGDVLTESAVDKCVPPTQVADPINIFDLNKVKLEAVSISGVALNCGPFADEGNVKSASGTIKLIDGEGYVICEMPSSDYKDKQNAYTTPMTIKLIYGYRSSVQRTLKIIKED